MSRRYELVRTACGARCTPLFVAIAEIRPGWRIFCVLPGKRHLPYSKASSQPEMGTALMQRQQQREAGATQCLAIIDDHTTAMPGHDFLYDGEPQTIATAAPGAAIIESRKGLENR